MTIQFDMARNLFAEEDTSIGFRLAVSGLMPTDEVLGEVTRRVAETEMKNQNGFAERSQGIFDLFGRRATSREFLRAQLKFGEIFSGMKPAALKESFASAGLIPSGKNPFLKDVPADLAKAMLAVDGRASNTLLELSNFVRIPSVSSHFNHNWTAASWVQSKLLDLGFEVRIVYRKGANPLIYAERIINPRLPTLGIYAHGDTQPVKDQVWETDPWKAVIQDGRLYGRGAADDKAGVMVAIGAEKALIDAKVEPKVNRVFIIEFEEEIGSPNLDALLGEIPNIHVPDVVLLIDSSNDEAGKPAITMSMRGYMGYEVTIDTAQFGSHSGANALIQDAFTASAIAFGGMFDEDGMVAIPGLTDLLPEDPAEILANLGDAQAEERKMREGGGAFDEITLLGDPQIHPAIRSARRVGGRLLGAQGIPSLTAAGQVIPSVTTLLEFRVPPGVDVAMADQAIRAEITSRAQSWGSVSIRQPESHCFPWEGGFDNPFVATLSQALARGYGVDRTIFHLTGGTIGFLEPFRRRFPETVLIPIGIEDPLTKAHAANESLHIPDLFNAIRGVLSFMFAMLK